MKKELSRVCIYPKDIQRITGRSERYCRKLVSRIKKLNNKEAHQFISIQEFCAYTGLKVDEVKGLIVG
jgi:hypothetical protein